MFSRLTLLLSPLLLACAAFAQTTEVCPEEITARIDAADALKSSGELSRALARCAKILADAPDCPDAHVLRGNIYSDLEDLGEAKKSFAHAVSRDPGHVDAYVGLADVADERGDAGEALRHLETAISLDPEHYDARWLRGWVNEQEENYAAVEEDMAYLAELDPQSVCVLERLGEALDEQEKLGESEAVYRRLLAVEPGHSRGWVSLFGVVAFQENRDDEALEILEEGLAQTDGPEYLLSIAAHWHFVNERFAEAITSVKDALARNPKLDVAWETLGGIYYTLDDFDQASAAYSEALALEPDNLDYLRKRAHVAYLSECYFLASLDGRNILRRDPEDWWASFVVARGLSWRDKNEEALPFISEALRLRPDEEDVLDEYGYILYEVGDVAGALEKFKRSLELYPDNDYAREWVADLEGERSGPIFSLPKLDASPLSLLGYALAVLSIFGIVRTITLARVG